MSLAHEFLHSDIKVGNPRVWNFTALSRSRDLKN